MIRPKAERLAVPVIFPLGKNDTTVTGIDDIAVYIVPIHKLTTPAVYPFSHFCSLFWGELPHRTFIIVHFGRKYS